MDQDKIGKLIAKLRKSKKLTQEQLGAKLGVNSKAVSKWECGLTTPDISIVNELAHILGITTTELLDGKQTTNINDDMKLKDKIKTFIRKNYIFILLIFVLAITSITFFLYFINNYKKYQLINFNTNDDTFYMEGYIAVYPDKELIIIEDFGYQSDEIGTNKELRVSQLNIRIITDNKSIFEYYFVDEKFSSDNTPLYPISKVVDEIDIKTIVDNKNNFNFKKDKFYLLVEYKTEKEIIKKEYELNVSIDESSSKFIK